MTAPEPQPAPEPAATMTPADLWRRWRAGLTWWDRLLLGGLLLFVLLLIAGVLVQPTPSLLYAFLERLHYWISRVGLAVALAMGTAAFYIGVRQKRDVLRWFRSATYTMVAVMLLQGMIGVLMYVQGARPYQEIHWFYGIGVVLALPFFIYVEVTAQKRPAMGSYIWGFFILAGIITRSMATGAPG